MEGEKQTRAARELSHCQLNHGSERGLTPDQYVAIKRQEGVELVMAKFNRWLDKRLAIISCMSQRIFFAHACEASEASGSSAGSSKGTESGSGSSEQGQSGRSTRTKRRLGGDDQDNSSAGGDEGDPDRGGSKRAKKDTESERKFACPFYKNDPKAHNKHRSCAGPGWTSLHRLKEHLYRAHRLPKHVCPRCTDPFDDAKDLAEHIRADVPCEKLDVVPVLQGIDEATEAKLKVRRKNCPGMTDEQRWGEIYKILFPSANFNAMPTPYYDGNDSLGFSKRAEWKKVEKRLRKELPKFVQKKVERSFEKVQADMLVGLPDIIRDGLFEFFKDLPHNDLSASATPAATPRARTPSSPVAREQPAPTSEEDKDALLDVSYFLDPTIDEFDMSPFDFGNPNDCHFFDKYSDSGYASTSTGRDGTVETDI
ncbi:putative udp-glucoronosyl and udp-glucosyl transferase family protein [Daldinia childiae]|uniref:putative udp-glucoronosyl and udp-glucosyl transferase family protein n=1 Tax=Daldinia childiae TaxID=326645 RepID=UPI001444E0D3|nr:putative udp-glucoronosyl and udp-glucosyl transferase family protein [Daldinia childiae]KAF3070443.1 putative udp-glucoronosyl and udp-glucosyl transferase family protein [Daldinia childiae]